MNCKLHTNLLIATLLITNLLIINYHGNILLQQLYILFYVLLGIHYYYTVFVVLLNEF